MAASHHLEKILNGRISAKGHAIHFMLGFYGRVFRAPILYSAHRAVIFAISQLSCLFNKWWMDAMILVILKFIVVLSQHSEFQLLCDVT